MTTHTFILPSGETVLIDAVDRDLVEAAGPWYALRNQNTTYVTANRLRSAGSHTTVRLHRLILDPPDDLHVDHINRDGLDNRRINLRTCTRSQNQANSPSRIGSSRFKGVYWDKVNAKWRAQGCDGTGINLRLGRFANEYEAARAYDVHATETYGEFAWLNADHFVMPDVTVLDDRGAA